MSNETPNSEPAKHEGNDQNEENKEGRHIFTSYLTRTKTGFGVTFSDEPPPPPPDPVRRPARVARMLALAHRIQRAIDNGDFQDRAALARHYELTRARVTQLLNLTLLAPDIQEKVLGLESVDGLEPTSERAIRTLVLGIEWNEQRNRWRNLRLRAR